MLKVDLLHLPWMALHTEFAGTKEEPCGIDIRKLANAVSGTEIFGTRLPLINHFPDTDTLIEALRTSQQVEIDPFEKYVPLGIALIVSIVPEEIKDRYGLWPDYKGEWLSFRKK